MCPRSSPPLTVRVFAPATVANLGPGFDVLGLALERPGDVVEAERRGRSGVEIVEITGDDGRLSRDADENVLSRAATEVLRRSGATDVGLTIRLHKRMPLASGLGSSGASSAAGALAAHVLVGSPLSQVDLLRCAMEGERAATGAAHADNVAPSLLGGIVLIRSYEPLEVVPLPVPASLWVAVCHPHCELATAKAREVVGTHRYRIGEAVHNLGNVGAFVAALYANDLPLLGRAIDDRLVEPLRAPLIPGFREVKQAAIVTGALGASIAGAGPSVFALCESETIAGRTSEAMTAAFRDAAGLDTDLFVSRVAPEGARVLVSDEDPLGT